MTADIISRLFFLTDVLSNYANINFVQIDGRWKVMIIDFRVSRIMIQPSLDGGYCFDGIISGNGEFLYVDLQDDII